MLLFIHFKIIFMKKDATKPVEDFVSMPLVHARAAGIDIGDSGHPVAIPGGIFAERVKTFGSMTCDLEAIAVWLTAAKITTVALESTGVYRKPLFSLLNQKGFEVYLVNSKQTKMYRGAKQMKQMPCGYKNCIVADC